MVSFLLLYLVLVFLPNILPFNGLFLTPLHLVLLFYLLLYLTLVSSHSPTLCWSLYLLFYLTLVSFLLLYTLCWSFYLPLYLTLDSFTPIYLVLVFLSTPTPYTGLFHTPLPCTGHLTHSYTLHWSLSHSSLFSHSYTLHWSLSHSSLYPLLYITLISFTLLCFFPLLYLTQVYNTLIYLVLAFLPNFIPCVGLFFTPLPCAGLSNWSYILHWSLSLSVSLTTLIPCVGLLPNSIPCTGIEHYHLRTTTLSTLAIANLRNKQIMSLHRIAKMLSLKGISHVHSHLIAVEYCRNFHADKIPQNHLNATKYLNESHEPIPTR